MRVYHAGRDPSQRARERALARAGEEPVLLVPRSWPGGGSEQALTPEPFPIVELETARAGDVNRHVWPDEEALRRVIDDVVPDVLDLHEEPFSIAARQWLAAAPADLPVVMYTAQNIDKRYPPPFAGYERDAYRRVSALYACSRQAASVARGKGFAGSIEVLPLGYDPALFRPGEQSAEDDELVLALFGRLVPEKGVQDAVRVLARLSEVRPARLLVVGTGPEEQRARDLVKERGLADWVSIEPWRSADELAALYRRAHVVLVPSVPTHTWTEQFGRVIVEAQASGAVVAGYSTGSIPEVAGDAAVLVEAGDADALADGVVRLVADPDDYTRRRTLGIALCVDSTWGRVAERQRELYARVAQGDIPRTELPRSPRNRRAAARAEFGPTAPTRGGTRPFALPLLRRGGPPAALLGAAIDCALEVRARLPRS